MRSVAVSRDAMGMPEVFGVGRDNRLYVKAWSYVWASYGDWFQLSLPAVQSVTAVTDKIGRVQVFAVGTDNLVYSTVEVIPRSSLMGLEASYVASGLPFSTQRLILSQYMWSGGTTRLSDTPVTQLQAARDGTGAIQLYAISANSALWHRTQSSTLTAWSAWSVTPYNFTPTLHMVGDTGLFVGDSARYAAITFLTASTDSGRTVNGVPQVG
jgi:hypothetical protein